EEGKMRGFHPAHGGGCGHSWQCRFRVARTPSPAGFLKQHGKTALRKLAFRGCRPTVPVLVATTAEGERPEPGGKRGAIEACGFGPLTEPASPRPLSCGGRPRVEFDQPEKKPARSPAPVFEESIGPLSRSRLSMVGRLRSFDGALLDPRHETAEARPDLFDGVPLALLAQLVEILPAARRLGDPAFRELAALDVLESLLHALLDGGVDDGRPRGEVAVFGGLG